MFFDKFIAPGHISDCILMIWSWYVVSRDKIPNNKFYHFLKNEVVEEALVPLVL